MNDGLRTGRHGLELGLPPAGESGPQGRTWRRRKKASAAAPSSDEEEE
jgi:hypothetical protein